MLPCLALSIIYKDRSSLKPHTKKEIDAIWNEQSRMIKINRDNLLRN